MLELLHNTQTPDSTLPFDKIRSEEFPHAIDRALEKARERRKSIETTQNPNFTNVIEALELSSLELDQVSTLFFNLYQACTDEILDQAVGEISEKLSEHSSDTLLSDTLFQKVLQVYQQKEKLNLNVEQAKLLEETYLSFTRNGALLSTDKKQRLREIDQELASLSPRFSQNLLKATHQFHLNITDENKVKNLPEHLKESAAHEAQDRKQQGWTFTLQAPSYVPFMQYMEDRSLRETLWRAYNTKAISGEHSNRELCGKIARLKQERAQLLGYSSHSAFVLEKRMAKSEQTVRDFLNRLKQPSLIAAQKELSDLKNFVQDRFKFTEPLMPWDFSFYSEKYKQQLFDLSEEELRPYFPLQQVVEGVLIHGQKLYGFEFKKRSDIATYHPDVMVYSLHRGTEFVGILYLDLYPRENKKSGAWMTNFQDQGFDGAAVQRPHVSIVCNFTKPTVKTPSLLTFNEVQTLFHEFGHALHSLSSHCYYRSLAGTNVLWDFVELPSQIMENWTYETESLALYAKHYETGQPLPHELIQKLKDSMNFQAGYASLRQLQFSYVDLAWHGPLDQQSLDPLELETKATQDLQLLPRVEGTNFSVGFSHIFAGGYSSGYYSYKWAEVLDADAFEAFQEQGIFNPEVARRFYDCILSKGGVEDPAVLYKKFRGRDPDPQALLRRSGLA